MRPPTTVPSSARRRARPFLLLALTIALLLGVAPTLEASAATTQSKPYIRERGAVFISGAEPAHVGVPMTVEVPVYNQPTYSFHVEWELQKNGGDISKRLEDQDGCLPAQGAGDPCKGWPRAKLTYTPKAEDEGWVVAVSFWSTSVEWPGGIPDYTWTKSWPVGEPRPHLADEVVETQTMTEPRWGRVTWTRKLWAGNPGRIGYTVVNTDWEPKSFGVRVLDEKGAPVEGSSSTVTVPARGRKEQTVPLKTWGMAHDQGQRKDFWRYTIEVRPSDGPAETAPLTVAVEPRPVVLAHGYNSSAAAWDEFPEIVQGMDSRMRLFAVGDGQVPGTEDTGDLLHPSRATKTIHQNAEQVGQYVEGVRAATGAQHVDIVAHSMGGLISRDYIQTLMPASADKHPVVGHLAQLGTPNMGSPCADSMMLWQAANPLFPQAFPQPATTQLTTWAADTFNGSVTDLKGVELSNLVGTGRPIPCGTPDFGDIVVPTWSAEWTLPFGDLFDMSILHTDMTADDDVVRDYVLPRLSDAPGTGVPPMERSARRGVVRAADTTATAMFDSGQLDVGPDRSDGWSAPRVLTVPAGDSFGVTVLAPDVEVELTGPDGTKVEAPASASGLAVTGASVSEHQAGRWTLRLRNVGDPGPETAPFTAQVTGSDLTVRTTAVRSGAAGEVRADLSSQAKPVTGAKVSAVLDAADGTHQEVTLLDDGRHGDGTAGDGRYGTGARTLGPETSAAVVHVDASGKGSRWVTARFTTTTPTDPTPARPTLRLDKAVSDRRGKAVLKLTGSAAGTVRLTGKGVRTQRVKANPKARIIVVATGRTAKQLRRHGRVAVRIKVVLTTRTGVSVPVTRRIVLKIRR